jgi:glycosyltransferase involved in cell wall biosynthesis
MSFQLCNINMNILILTDDLLYVSGVSKHLYYLLEEISRDEKYNIFLVCPGGDFISEFTKLRITVIVRKDISHKKRSLLNFLNSTLYIRSLVIKEKIRIIHSHTHYSANIAWWTSKLTNSITTIQTIHGIIPPGGRLPHIIADYFIAVNKNTINYLVSIGKSKERIYFVNLGIPFPEEHFKDNSEIKILFASRLVPEKGADIFLDAIALVSNKLNKKATFLMAGEGECENELKDQISRLKIDVNFLGKVKDMNQYLKDTHIFVFSSKYQAEGFPLSIIEAMLNANLLITSDFTSLTEIFEDGKDCMIFYNNDPVQLAGKISLAVSKYEEYSEMILNGMKKARNNFSVHKMVLEMKNIYQNVS